MTMDYEKLLAENEALRLRLEEAEETLAAIRGGEVDALVVASDAGEKIFTLAGADQPYRVMVETMSEGAATLNPDSTVLFANSQLARLLDSSLDKILGKPLLAHVAPVDAPVFVTVLERALATSCRLGESFRAEITFRTKAGSAVPALLSCCSLDLGGSPGISVIVTDLSEQKRNEEIVAAGELASSILDQAGEAIIVCNAGGRVIRASRQAHELFGKNPLFRPFNELGLLQVPGLGEPFSISAPLGGKVLQGVEVTMARGGRQLHLLLSATPLIKKKRFLGCVVTLTDYTERKQAEEALQYSNDRLAAAIAIAQLGVWEYETSAAVTHFDPRSCDVLGLGENRLLSNDQVFALIHTEDRCRVEGQVRSALEPHGPGVYDTEYRVVRPDGSQRWVAVRGHAIRSGEAIAGRFVGTLMDITERKRAEEEISSARIAAEEANRAKSEFLANMSHEIRTPMTVFMAAIEHLQQMDGDPERRPLLAMADQAANRLRALIDDILDLSRIEARKVDIEATAFDLRSVVREAVDLFLLPAGEKNLRLEIEVAPETPEVVVGDPGRLGQVLVNLIGNAVKFTPAGEIRVSVRPRSGALEFAVADTGIGIPEDKHDLLFASFSQVDSSFTRQYGGTGLGLAICKGLVELMGGEIGVRSREGSGSAFTFTLPLRTDPAPRAAAADAVSKGAGRGNSVARILLAEDDPMIRKMLTLMLAKDGYRLDYAETGRAALEKWESGDFDLIFMDLQMPEMSGLEATRAIRERETDSATRTCIVGLTAHVRREIHEECLQAGMNGVLSKPVRMAELQSAIHGCLQV